MTEIELKFTGAAGDIAALPDSLFMKAMMQGRAGAWERLASTYYDTPDGALEREGLSLRLREENGRRVQAVKRPHGPGSVVRDEFERELTDGEAFPAETGDPAADASIAAAAEALAPTASTVVDRWSAVVRFATSDIEIAVDLGRAESRSASGEAHRAPLAEVELELIDGEPGDLFDLGRLLAANAPVRIRTQTKLEYARALSVGGPYRIAAGKRLQLNPEESAASALDRSLLQIAARLASLQPVLLEARHPEGVHQMRVALRRLRAIERTFRPFVGGGVLRALAERAKLIAKALGPARDWDVFLEETLPDVLGHAYAPAGAGAVRGRAMTIRAAAWAEVVKVVSDQAFTCFLIDILEAATLSAWQAPDGGALEETVAEAAPRALDRRLKRAFKTAKTIDRSSLEGWHPLRIALKKLRYPVQMFRSAYPKEARKTYMSALSELQDAFGHINDAAVAQRLANEAAEGAGEEAMRAAGFICGYKAAEVEAAAANIETAFEAFASLKPFWRED